MNEPSFILIRLEFMTEPIEQLQGFFSSRKRYFLSIFAFKFYGRSGPYSYNHYLQFNFSWFFCSRSDKEKFPPNL